MSRLPTIACRQEAMSLDLYRGMECMRVIEIPYSEALAAVLHLSPAAFEHEAKMALAVKLFELGR